MDRIKTKPGRIDMRDRNTVAQQSSIRGKGKKSRRWGRVVLRKVK